MANEYSFPSTNAVPLNIQHAKINPQVLSGFGATKTLVDEEAGGVILMDRAAGIVFTLPTPRIGMTFDFIVSVSVTSNAYKIITNAGTVFLVGQVLSNDTDTSGAAVFFAANGSTHVAINMTGSTKGGLIGSRIRLTCISATLWLIEGINNGSGTVETPFATS